MEKLTFAVVGSGWRAAFYARIAAAHPECFALTGMLCRTREKAELLRQRGLPATDREEDLLRARPDFIVTAVSREAGFETARRWLERGFAVMAETPAGCSVEELRALWELSRSGARLTVAEQYFRYPLLAAGLRRLDSGLIGDPHAVSLSLCHDYHAASLARRMLGMHRGKFPDFTVSARARTFPVEETDSRYGPVNCGRVFGSRRVTAEVDFDNGKTFLYDFDSVQYHSFIRFRHLDVRGERGQWGDAIILYSDHAQVPRRELVGIGPIPGYEHLMTPELAALGREWSPFVRLETAQDEYAMATLLLDMGRFLREGVEPYPLREALEDAYMWLLMREAAESGGIVMSGERAWRGDEA